MTLTVRCNGARLVTAELAGDKQVSLVLLDDSGTNQMLRFRSRTTENDPPGLELVAAVEECTPSGTSAGQVAGSLEVRRIEGGDLSLLW